ncbi:MAG: AAA family ATPase [Catenulispora sp.]|nr:AAA family ATPase [Catenulispora sp.]
MAQIRSVSGHAMVPVNRRREADELRRLADAVRAGGGRALVVSGEAGIGKTALLDHLEELAAGCRLVRVTGVQSEMELAFAGLHQLCAPMLDRLESVPPGQFDALRVALGLVVGPSPDRAMVGLAVLGLLSEAAAERPLICIVDDHQWLDRESALVLASVARRLGADPVGLVFATRDSGGELAGLMELQVSGLAEEDARALLDFGLTGPLDERVRDQIVAETRGNPLALLELPRGLSPAELAGGFGLPAMVPLSGPIEESFRNQLQMLAPEVRRLLQVAAAEPSGEVALVRDAVTSLGIGADVESAAGQTGLITFSDRVRFRHPLLRSVAYRSAGSAERRAAHLALAGAIDAAADPDRRAWHRAAAATEPDEEIADELERSAARARARGGLAAAAAFWQRAAVLSADPARRVERLLAAAENSLQAGAYDPALDQLQSAETEVLSAVQSARVNLLRAQVIFASHLGSEPPRLLLKAAEHLTSLDRDLARDTYLTAWMAALFAGRRAGDADLSGVSRAARALPPPPGAPTVADLVLDGLTLLVTEGPATAAPVLRHITKLFTDAELGEADHLKLGWFAQAAASALWDYEAWQTMLRHQVQVARAAGALDRLPILLEALGMSVAWDGDFTTAATLLAESEAVCDVTGTTIAPFIATRISTQRGDHERVLPQLAAVAEDAAAHGQGIAESWVHWNRASLFNGMGRYEEALESAAAAAQEHPGLYVSLWALHELVEAAVRSGRPDLGRDALRQLSLSARAGGTDFGLGVEARSQALLSEGVEAEALHREAVERLARSGPRPELARAHLLYGEWLRRENRRTDARMELHTAYAMFTDLGIEAFAERARRELAACGANTRKRVVETVDPLTAQEELIARLARDGRTNPEIGTQLFISARTVEWHLRRVFAKLGITSRRELASALPSADGTEPRLDEY